MIYTYLYLCASCISSGHFDIYLDCVESILQRGNFEQRQQGGSKHVVFGHAVLTSIALVAPAVCQMPRILIRNTVRKKKDDYFSIETLHRSIQNRDLQPI